ncbi:MAG: class I mannose-6-phosphate isomerase [Bacteroidales bacterium]|nr:class I mannose-6-phosphate isomerase [Bacteroidales bacterium]
MDVLYPLKFKPVYKEKIWGGNKIKTNMNMPDAHSVHCGEAWVLSGVPGDESVVNNGALKDNTLNELVEIFMGDLTGDKLYHKYGEIFPVLIKFIDANDWLSIQVHPDDKLAGERHNSFGKTEMWYILEAEAGSELISGFSKDVEKQEFIECVKNSSLKEMLNFEKVKKGDVFYIPAGRVHALGPGILLAEIQQTSDITYRIYDWDRIDASGLPRELHTEHAVAAIDFSKTEYAKSTGKQKINKTNELVSSDKFTTNLLELDKGLKKDYSELDSFVAYVCIEGNMKIQIRDNETVFQTKGETVLIPNVLNEVEIYPQNKVKFLEVYIA